MAKLRQTPTDRQILENIYNCYYLEFQNNARTSERSTLVFVPIDFDFLAKRIGIDADILFGRIHHDLNGRYKYKSQNDAWVSLFELKVGNDIHAVNFPYLCGILARLQYEENTKHWALTIAIGSLVISSVSLLLSIISLASSN